MPIIHTRLRIDYADQNEEFAPHLPRMGTVTHEFRDTEGGGPWLLVELEEPFHYQLEFGEPLQFRQATIDAILVRSRWVGCKVGDLDDVPVFLLLVEDGKHPTGSVVDPQEFVHIAWGTCRPVA